MWAGTARLCVVIIIIITIIIIIIIIIMRTVINVRCHGRRRRSLHGKRGTVGARNDSDTRRGPAAGARALCPPAASVTPQAWHKDWNFLTFLLLLLLSLSLQFVPVRLRRDFLSLPDGTRSPLRERATAAARSATRV